MVGAHGRSETEIFLFGLKQVGKLVNLSGLCREVYFRVWFEYALSQVHLSGSGMSLWVG